MTCHSLDHNFNLGNHWNLRNYSSAIPTACKRCHRDRKTLRVLPSRNFNRFTVEPDLLFLQFSSGSCDVTDAEYRCGATSPIDLLVLCKTNAYTFGGCRDLRPTGFRRTKNFTETQNGRAGAGSVGDS